MERKREQEIQAFIEEVGLMFEKWSMPRMSGRILGWLLLAEPARQSAAQLAERVGASKGSISTNTRLLIQGGLIEKVGVPGVRSTFYKLVEQPLERLIHAELTSMVELRRMAERGLELTEEDHVPQRNRLKALITMWKFFEREMSRLTQKFEIEVLGKTTNSDGAECRPDEEE